MKVLYYVILLNIFRILSSFIINVADPNDFFYGAVPRPKLVIIKPENGAIVQGNELTVEIQVVSKEQLTTSFHNSKICIALSTGKKLIEECFEHKNDENLIFHADGLSPGNSYVLRVVFYERGDAIAVSIRNFRVGGIKGLITQLPNEIVSIQTAVQVAVEYQVKGMEAQAEEIYRAILAEFPSHPEALHLLGVVFYQRGEPQTAIPYIEKALQGTPTKYMNFHNSLGECYRTLGRLSEALHQFKLELALNPNYASAMYNLALTYQQSYDWLRAVDIYRDIIRRYKESIKDDPILVDKHAKPLVDYSDDVM